MVRNATKGAAAKPLVSGAATALLLLLPPMALGWTATAAGSLAAIGPQKRWGLGLLLFLLGWGASAVLALEHLGHIRAPGCTEGGACAQLNAGRWGKVFGWPLAFLGTAWFAALAVFQVSVWRQPVPGLLLLGLTVGAIGSLFFLTLILVLRHVCPYCLMVHSANLTAWLLFLTAPDRAWLAPRGLVGAALAAATFCGMTVLLACARTRTRRIVAQRREQSFQQSLRRVHRHLYQLHKHRHRAAISGRWWRGVPTAAVRLVIYSDYQCSDCRHTEAQLETALSARCEVAVTFKHFPLSHACNPRIHSLSDHPHACRAALAAEAAGQLGGNRGFLMLHDCLLQRNAVFTDAELAAALPQFGFTDPVAFFQAMHGPQAQEHLREDIEEAIRLGVVGTPAVFVEGIRLEGIMAERAIARLLESLDHHIQATRPPTMTERFADGQGASSAS